jgi:Histidine kinase-, DNA gyrase B-, and HSP90-like ATPase
MSTLVTANAAPAKRFFVDMLIRDIELKDAILDLLDNCVDGAMRLNNKTPPDLSRPFAGRFAKIEFSKSHFWIEDNCGGIPRQIALESAFRLGRANTELDRDIPTVGVYGIGMKRAIFKMGRCAAVETKSSDGTLTVDIDADWMENDLEWALPVKDVAPHVQEMGTRIYVSELRDGVARQFSDDTGFVEELKRTIAASYGYIIEKGFDVQVNSKSVVGQPVALLFDKESFVAASGIAPFIYEGKSDAVSVYVAVGFYRELPNENEESEALESGPTSDRAGITVICNDRVVLYADKTRVTGWGEATVPQYHTQFVSIAGVVVFTSNDAAALPVTTTKRGIDGNSELYLEVKDQIREGLKSFTDFTNKWKKSAEERTTVQRSAEPVGARSMSALIPDTKWTKVTKGIGGRKFKPALPLPKESDPLCHIRFTRKKSDVAAVSQLLFESSSRVPSEVGEKCFDDVLRKATK